MKKPLVVDLDDTLSHHVEHLLEVYNAESGDDLKYDDITSWNISDFAIPEFKGKVNSYFSRPGWFRGLKPRLDAQEALKNLLQVYESKDLKHRLGAYGIPGKYKAFSLKYKQKDNARITIYMQCSN